MKSISIYISLFLLLSCMLITCSAQQKKEVNSPLEEIEAFFSTYKKDEKQAIRDILHTSSKKNDEAIVNELYSNLSEVVKLLGPYYSYELILKRKASESMLLYSYLVKYEDQPLRFTFIFYKPNNNWKLYDLAFDSDVDKELKHAAEIFLIEETYSID